MTYLELILYLQAQMAAVTAKCEQTAQPEQEPVAYYHPHKGFYWAKPTSIFAPTVVDVQPMPLYVKWKAAQRPWVGLTDEEKFEMAAAQYGWEDLLIAAEAKLKELNNG